MLMKKYSRLVLSDVFADDALLPTEVVFLDATATGRIEEIKVPRDREEQCSIQAFER